MKRRRWPTIVGAVALVLTYVLGRTLESLLGRARRSRAGASRPCWVALEITPGTWGVGRSFDGRRFRIDGDKGGWCEGASAPKGWAEEMAERLADDLNQAERRR